MKSSTPIDPGLFRGSPGQLFESSVGESGAFRYNSGKAGVVRAVNIMAVVKIKNSK